MSTLVNLNMGCIAGKPDINDVHANIFCVLNLDDSGQVLCSGQLEVTEVELILYQHAKTPIRWPLRSLRRYGFDNEIFTFESGRRCVTGPGIYAFKCQRAEQLFNLLQVKFLAAVVSTLKNMNINNFVDKFNALFKKVAIWELLKLKDIIICSIKKVKIMRNFLCS